MGGTPHPLPHPLHIIFLTTNRYRQKYDEIELYVYLGLLLGLLVNFFSFWIISCFYSSAHVVLGGFFAPSLLTVIVTAILYYKYPFFFLHSLLFPFYPVFSALFQILDVLAH